MEFEGKSYEDLKQEVIALRRRLAELNDITSDLKRSEEALRLDEARLEALFRLASMTGESEQDIVDFALAEAIRLTGSEVGWIGAVSDDDTQVTLYNWTSDIVGECGVVGLPQIYYLKDGGLWAEPIFQRKPVIVNDYAGGHPAKKGLPEGHIPLKNFLAIPVFDGEKIVAVAELANKKADYDMSDARQLTLLMSGLWKVILRKRTDIALVDSKMQAELYVDLMGHDINNMNQISIGFLEMAIEKLCIQKSLTPEDCYLLEKPVDTLKNSSRLIENVKKLQSARSGGLRSTLIDLDRILIDVVKEYSGIPGRQVTINYDPLPGSIIRANGLIRDVFLNIVGNSIKHSPASRPLTVDISLIKTKIMGREQFVVTIEDNGPGIPDDKKISLFVRLAKGEKRKKISGLGLGLVKTLVEDFKGNVWMEDRVKGDHNHGTRLVVTIPVVE